MEDENGRINKQKKSTEGLAVYIKNKDESDRQCKGAHDKWWFNVKNQNIQKKLQDQIDM